MTTQNILARLRGVTPLAQNKWRSFCPCHEDHDPSLEIEELADGKTVVNCFPCNSAGNPRGFVAGLAVAIDLPQAEFFAASSRRQASGGSGGSGKSAKSRGKLPPGSKKIAEWEYRDEDGALRYKTVRYDLPDGGKQFVQMRPNGQGGWIKNLKGVSRIPYRLPELLAADKAAIVWIPEGEKCVDALRDWGEVATCNSGGAGKWLRDHAAYLRNRRVVILPDNDATDPRTGKNAGMDHARDVAASLQGIAASVRILQIPGLPPKGDVWDWKAAGHGRQELLELLAAAEAGAGAGDGAGDGKSPTAGQPAAAPPAAAEDFEADLLKALGLQVLGEIEGRPGSAKVFCEPTQRVAEIPQVDRLSFERILSICGRGARAKVMRSGDTPAGVYTVADVREAIAVMAGGRTIGSRSQECGRGVWLGLHDDGSPDGSLVLVNSGEASRFVGGKLERVRFPMCGGLTLDFGQADKWCDFEQLAEYTERAKAVDFRRRAIEDCFAIFNQWRWKDDKDGRCATLVVGMILSSMVQTIFEWRPHIVVIGESGTGKSTFFHSVGDMLPKLKIMSSQSSAAGIRQSMVGGAPLILCDEIDSSKDRAQIFELLRASSRGDRVYRGTADQKGTSFLVRHIGWVGGVESGMHREPDRNRFLRLELLRPETEDAGKLARPEAKFAADLGQRLLATALVVGIEARELAVKMKAEKFTAYKQRTVESFAVPAAMLGLALGESRDDILAILGQLLSTAEPDDESETDSRTVLEAVLTSLIRLKGEQFSVSQLLAMRSLHDSATALAGVGILVDDDLPDGPHVFIAHREVKRHLLSQTEFRDSRIDELLKRAPGASKVRFRIDGRQPWGIRIPLAVALGSEAARGSGDDSSSGAANPF